MKMQSTDTVLMIMPHHFGSNQETLETNSFQRQAITDSVSEKAKLEVLEVVRLLEGEGVNVMLIEDRKDIVCPDAVFPNNWLGIHPGGDVITYPMLASNRRSERRDDIINTLTASSSERRLHDFSLAENEGKYLEGTGSLVFDHVRKIAFAAISPRTSKILAQQVCDLLGYELVSFNTSDKQGKPIYHTNVVLSIGSKFVVIAKDVIVESDREFILNRLIGEGRVVIEISESQLECFAGNILEIRNHADEKLIVISETALNSLNPIQISSIQKSGLLLMVSVPIIEQVGGGSVRCMLAEIFHD
ncbi:MAG: arginine deiminase-related protein [Bacteroidia bacterium]